jgi:hypothetical protein
LSFFITADFSDSRGKCGFSKQKVFNGFPSALYLVRAAALLEEPNLTLPTTQILEIT